MTNKEFLYWLAEEINRVIDPLKESLESEESFSKNLEKYGWVIDPNAFNIAAIRDTFEISKDLNDIVVLLNEISSTTRDLTPLAQYVELTNNLRKILSKVQNLSNLPSPGFSAQLWTQFTSEVTERLIAEYLESYHPAIFAILLLLGIVDEKNIDVGAIAGRTNYTKYTIVWDRLLTALTKPSTLMKEVYAWGDPGRSFDFILFLERLKRFFYLFSLPATLDNPRPELVNQYYDPGNPSLPKAKELGISLIQGDDGAGNSIEVSIYVFPITPDGDTLGNPNGIVFGSLINSTGFALLSTIWPFSVDLSGVLESNDAVKIEVRPNRVKPILASAGETKIDTHAALVKEPAYPQIIFGTLFSDRLQISGWRASLGVRGPLDDPELEIELSFDKAEIIIDGTDADSFVKKIIGNELQTIKFAGAIVWSSKTGLHFKGQGGLKMLVPINQTISVLKLDSLALGVNLSDIGIDLSVGLTGSTRLGPLTISIDNIGIKLMLRNAPAGKAGLLGDLDLEFGFKSPDGLGLAIDSDFVTGGGYLFFDETKGEYAGILNLEIKGISLTAVGILTTKRPDGQEGFSLLIIISSEFPPIQLGFGFKLNGVGGILGLNRTVVAEVLREGIKNRTLDSILFPPNPVENAPKIISDLKQVFPDAEGRFIFGPMAKIGWGTPTVIVAEVGLALEVPDPVRLVLLGRIRAALPEGDKALIQLNMDVLGVLDFEKSIVSIDATIYDSRLLLYSLSGDMALRAGWGANPIFALSVGGLNPRFQPPSGFPTLSRLQVSMGVGNNPRLSLQAYLAITSNTVQFGALLELYAEAFGFNIKGHLGFDCLFQLSPFEFIADISAGIAFRKGSKTLAAVYLRATLSGPRPWRARGKASISLLFIDVSVSFDVQWGDPSEVRLPEIEVWEHRLKPAIEDSRNWSAVLPPVSSRSVGYSDMATDLQKVVVVDPFGALVMRQKEAPLNQELTKFGNSDPASGNSYFNIKEVRAGDNPLPTNKEYDLFAPAQYRKMTDDEKLTIPEFERMESGVSVGANGTKIADKDTIKEIEMIFETFIIDLKGKKVGPEQDPNLKVKLSSGRAATMSEFSALKRSRWWNSGEDKYLADGYGEEKPAVVMEDEYFIVADKRNLKRRDDIFEELSEEPVPLTRSRAYDIMSNYLMRHPKERENLQVMSVYEVMQ